MIKIKYDGAFPNLCSGYLRVWVNDKYYPFGKYCLQSGGSSGIHSDGTAFCQTGLWSLYEDMIPENFPRNLIPELLCVINEEIPHGCCGGCI